jgi:hypothetical protein
MQSPLKPKYTRHPTFTAWIGSKNVMKGKNHGPGCTTTSGWPQNQYCDQAGQRPNSTSER